MWWFRRAGGREVLMLALPLVVSTLSYSLMHFVDRMMLAWYSTAALAAAIGPGVLMWTLFSLPLGVASFATTFVAQYHGANQPDRIGRIIWQAVRVGLYCVPLFLLIGLFGPSIFRAAGHPEGMLWLEALYFQSLAYGAGASVLSAALSSYFVGLGRTKVVMLTSLTSTGLNIVLDIILIFGFLGIPALGIEGAGIATSIAMWAQVAIYAVLIARSGTARIHGFAAGRVFDVALTARLLRFGTPAGLQFLLEGLAITVFVIVMGAIHDAAAAATAVAFSINMVAFVPIFGLGMAITASVGQYIGSGRSQLAARATWTGLILGLAYTSLFAVSYFAVPHWYLAGHAAVAADADFETVRRLTIMMLAFVAVYCMFDTVQIVFVSALKGAGDTWFILKTTVATGGLFVAIGMIGDRVSSDPDVRIYTWWLALTAWVLSLATAYLWRFLLGKWKSMSVIETNLIAEDDQVNADGEEVLTLADSALRATIG